MWLPELAPKLLCCVLQAFPGVFGEVRFEVDFGPKRLDLTVLDVRDVAVLVHHAEIAAVNVGCETKGVCVACVACVLK